MRTVTNCPLRGLRSAATARRIIAASQGMADYYLRQSIELEDYDSIEQLVSARITFHNMKLAGLYIPANSVYYLVKCEKFRRFFVVLLRQDGTLVPSIEDRSQFFCIKKVQEYREEARKALQQDKALPTPNY